MKRRKLRVWLLVSVLGGVLLLPLPAAAAEPLTRSADPRGETPPPQVLPAWAAPVAKAVEEVFELLARIAGSSQEPGGPGGPGEPEGGEKGAAIDPNGCRWSRK